MDKLYFFSSIRRERRHNIRQYTIYKSFGNALLYKTILEPKELLFKSNNDKRTRRHKR